MTTAVAHKKRSPFVVGNEMGLPKTKESESRGQGVTSSQLYGVSMADRQQKMGDQVSVKVQVTSPPRNHPVNQVSSINQAVAELPESIQSVCPSEPRAETRTRAA